MRREGRRSLRSRWAPRHRTDRQAGDDGGFVLLESIVAIALITVLMIALTSLFISSMQATAHQRASQGAIRLATDAADQARGLTADLALSGRDQSSVQAQFAVAPGYVKPWISTAGVQAYSAAAATGAGATPCPAGTTGTSCAALPTVPVTRTMSSASYAVNYYLQWCQTAPTGGAPNCANTAVATDASLRQYVRVVVAIGWTDSTCPTSGCSYVTSVMLSATGDPLFRFRNPPPPGPNLAGCTPQDSVAFESVDQNIVGTDGFCGFSGGVPPITWAATGLPDGLAVVAAGSIIGNPAVGGSFTVEVTATDAFLRTSSAEFTWTVSYPPLVAENPGDQASTVNAAITPLHLTATGGSRTAAFTDQATPTLPPGLTLQDNVISGTPTAAGSYPVVLTVTDQAAAMTKTVAFTWVVNGPPAVQPPPNTITAPGDTVRGQAIGSDGTPPYTYALQGAPGWMQIDPSTGTLSGTAGSEIADYPGIVITLTDARGAVAHSAAFTWSVYTIPTIVPPGDQTSEFNETVGLPLHTTCSADPCTVTTTNLPGWLTLDPVTNRLTGTAPAVQEFDRGITVTITDADGYSASSQFNWVVGPQRTITSPGNQVWTAGVPLSRATSNGLQITGDCSPDGPCTFSLAPGSSPLPTGLTMSATGLITGTPTLSGSGPTTWSGIVVQVTPTVGNPVPAEAFAWTINPPPTIGAPGNQRTALGAAVSKQLAVTCLSTPCSITAPNLPAGLAIDTTGRVTGTATTAGTSLVTITVTDKTGTAASRTFTWYVLGIRMPNISIPKSTGNCKNDSRQTVNLATYAAGYSAVDALTFTVSGGPGSIAISGSQMTVTAPCSTGSYTATVRVTDSGGGETPVTAASNTFTITVT